MAYVYTHEDHVRRNAVPGPYHAVAVGEDDPDVLRLELLMLRIGATKSVLMFAPSDIEALERILAAYKATFHVSGAPDRIVSNEATVRAAVDALNQATR